MDLTITSKYSEGSYTLSIGVEKNRIWIQRNGHEGGDFDADKVADVLLNAIDKFYKENH